MNRVLAGAITLASAGAVFQAVLDDDLHAGQVEPEAFASALSGATWLLVGVCAIGTVLTWAFVGASAETAVAPEHQVRHHFHLPGSGGSALPGLEEGLVALDLALGAGLLLGVVLGPLQRLLGFLQA
jgi:hypothetical protein